MKRLWLPVFVGGFVGVVSAQAGQQNTPADKAQKPTTLIGCVAQSGGVYRLDHAIISVDTDVDTQRRPSTEASATPKTLSYALTGADMKGHFGHKVEVTGTMSSEKPSKATSAITDATGTKLVGTLNVKAVKMVSETCP